MLGRFSRLYPISFSSHRKKETLHGAVFWLYHRSYAIRGTPRIAQSNLGPPQVFCLHWTQNILTQSYANQIPFCSGSITRATLSAELPGLAESNLGPPQVLCLHWTQNILIQAYDNQITLRSFPIRFSSLESHSSSNDWPVAKVQ